MTSADDFVVQLIQEKGLVQADALHAARVQVNPATPSEQQDSAVLDVLVKNNVVTVDQVMQLLAEEFHMEFVDPKTHTVSHEALQLIDKAKAKEYGVMPLDLDQKLKRITVAVSDPLNLDAVDNLSKVLGYSVNPVLCTVKALDEAIAHFYDTASTSSEYEGLFQEEEEKTAVQELAEAAAKGAKDDDAPIIRYVQMLISEAVKRRASDIHLEPLEKRFRVRYRIDGVLIEVENPPKRLQPPIISRLKLMSNVSLAEKRIPQDGRIQTQFGTKLIDLRVSILPTVYGESIVMRILDKEGLNLGMVQLGFLPDDEAVMVKIITLADGIFLVTGPTGSGKSTTLYSALSYINRPDKKIITVEDPVEYQLAGINQVQVKREVELTFSRALRAMLRQSPNVVMIGEIRDLETAEIAINASLTGHMVFSTLHTNDSVGAVTRLTDLGVKPFLVSASMRAVLAQRLVRRICKECKKPYLPTPKELFSLGLNEVQATSATFMKGEGCARCMNIGFRGRMGVFEIFMVNDEVRQMIYEARNLIELRQKARDNGMRTMREDGVRKVMNGMTTADEVVTATVA